MGKEAKDIGRLTDEERHTLPRLVAGPRVARDKALRARMLLKADVDGPSWNDGQITDACEVGMSTIHRVRQRFVAVGLDAALARQPPARTQPRTLDGAQEARLVAIACSQAPEGRASWTLRRLADQLVERELVASIGRDTVRQTLKNMTSSPG
jgi:transposase